CFSRSTSSAPDRRQGLLRAFAGFFVSILHHAEVRKAPLWNPPAARVDRRNFVPLQRLSDFPVPGTPDPAARVGRLFLVDFVRARNARVSRRHVSNGRKHCPRQRRRPRLLAATPQVPATRSINPARPNL